MNVLPTALGNIAAGQASIIPGYLATHTANANSFHPHLCAALLQPSVPLLPLAQLSPLLVVSRPVALAYKRMQLSLYQRLTYCMTCNTDRSCLNMLVASEKKIADAFIMAYRIVPAISEYGS